MKSTYKLLDNMENNTIYLHIIDEIDSPTTDDFFDYLKILSLLLQEEATKSRWHRIIANNFTVYDTSSFPHINMGVKLEYCFNDYKYEIGIRFRIIESSGFFSLYLILHPLWEKASKCIISQGIDTLECDINVHCDMCNEREICNSIYQATENIIVQIESKYKNGVRIYDELKEPIGIEIRLNGCNQEIFTQTCEYMDTIIPILTEETPTAVSKASIRLTSSDIALHKAFQHISSPMVPYFKEFEIDKETIEEIYNKPHGIEHESNGEESPF